MWRWRWMMGVVVVVVVLLTIGVRGFESDEHVEDENEEELGVVGTRTPTIPKPSVSSDPRRNKYSEMIQFPLHHAFGDSAFSPAATFSARLKSTPLSPTLTKLRFSRNSFSDVDQLRFQKLLEDDDFYTIRIPSNVLSSSSSSSSYVVSSVKARCLAREEGLDEHIIIHVDGAHVIALNYGPPAACPYPRQIKLPGKWSFNSHTILKNTEQASRAPVFSVDALGGENPEGEGVPPPERSFWAKYWMYLIPLGLVVMNVMTQAMNMPEEQGAQQAAVQRRQR